MQLYSVHVVYLVSEHNFADNRHFVWLTVAVVVANAETVLLDGQMRRTATTGRATASGTVRISVAACWLAPTAPVFFA